MAGRSSSESNKSDEDDVFSRFQAKFLKENPKFLDNLFGLNDAFYALCAYRIKSCNAAEPAFGVCFTDALCALRLDVRKKFAFGNFFIEAFRMIKVFVKDSKTPEDSHLKLLLSKLFKFLLDFENVQKPLFALKSVCDNEMDLTVVLASHFFSQLSISPTYTIDKSKSGKSKRCTCGKIHQSNNYGDTSLGNPDVWHGNIDVIMEGAGVIISHGREATCEDDYVIEVKPRSIQMNDVSIGGVVSKSAAETIVYSFHYRNNHPGDTNSLIPCIRVCCNGLVFYFYDSVNDVFLGGTLIPLFHKDDPKEVHIQSIIATWMVLNHRYLCNGLSRSTTNFPKAGFFELCIDKLEVYKQNLRRGNVLTKYEYPNIDPATFPGKYVIDEELATI